MSDADWYWVGGYAALLTLMSVATGAALAWDKWRATKQGRRVPERTLHALELLGGWPGSLVMRRWARHKTVKRSYRAWAAAMIVLHLAIVGALVWWRWG